MGTSVMNGKVVTDTASLQQVADEYKSLFTDKVSCSLDPFNPVVGYNLHDVSYDHCAAVAFGAMAKFEKFQVQGVECIEKIVDEGDGTAAVWAEVSNTGTFKAGFKKRMAIRFSFSGDKITSFHAVMDTYDLVNSGSELALSQAPPAWASWGLAAIGVAAMVSAFLTKRSPPKGEALLASAA